MKHLCYSCKFYKDCHHGLTSAGIIAGCPHYEKLVVTNADRIRAMTDEELAFYIVNHPMWSDESACVAWLKEPITEGESENPN